MLNRLAERAGIGKRVHAHGFRHSHAHLLRERGWDVEEIRKQLGHSNLLVTSDYLDHIGANRLPERMRDIGPVLGSVGETSSAPGSSAPARAGGPAPDGAPRPGREGAGSLVSAC